MKTPFDPHATNLRTAAESGPSTLWMAADHIDDLSVKLATATAELETAKGRTKAAPRLVSHGPAMTSTA